VGLGWFWEGLFGKRRDETRVLHAWRAERTDTSPLFAIDGELYGGWLGANSSFYVESTIWIAGRPGLRLGTHLSTKSRHQRSQPAGTQIRATS